MTPAGLRFCLAAAGLFFGGLLPAQTVPLAPQVVTASRIPQPPDQVAFALDDVGGDALRAAPTVTVDDALRALPDFSLFRRSDSLFANPTAQGVSLRGLAPSGASRSLVLLDGVPVTDPFGGWVTWAMLPRESLDRVELVPGGGASAWGNASLGGVVQLLTDPAAGERTRLAASLGDFSTRSLEFEVTQPAGGGTLQILGDDFATSGFPLVASEDRGPIDIAAWSRHRWLGARWREPLGDHLEVTVTARTFEEFRGNGTPYTNNDTRVNFVSAALASHPAGPFSWNATVYAQDEAYASTFSSVNAARTAETPANDQYAVPSTAGGAAWTGLWAGADGARTTAGIDTRFVRGETREDYLYSNGAFTRLRTAGGSETFAGLFAQRGQPLLPGLQLTLGARLDGWHEDDGHLFNRTISSGALVTASQYPNQEGTEFSPSAGLVWTPAPAWRLRAAAQQAFRVPTLNELYRPYQQGSTVVVANPALQTEHATTGELGADWTHGPFTLGATGFWTEVRDEVDNVTLAQGPGTFPLFGTLAAGAIGQQRLNLDRTRIRGIELSAKWQAAETLTVTADWLCNDATVLRASVAPTLVGKRLAQVPLNSASLGAVWRAPAGVTLTPRVRLIGRQFEDDQNTLVLGETVVADLTASRAISKHLELFLSVENLGDARIETGRSATGVVNTGTPRLAFGGVRGSW